MKTVNYYDLDIFKHIYLEDSFVLEINEKYGLLSFKIEFVLTKLHPLYNTPIEDEAHCFHEGFIDFINPIIVNWEVANLNLISIDKNEECDLGNIDIFFKEGENYILEGDWGKLNVQCERLNIRL